MKKQVTLLAGLLIMTGAANAQSRLDLPTQAKQALPAKLHTGKIVSTPGAAPKDEGDVLWANGFSSSTNWLSTANAGATPDATHGWVLATAPNQILPWAFSSGIASTGGGGYALCLNGDPGVLAPSPAEEVLTETEFYLTYDSTFDFSTYSNLVFQFEEYGAQFIEKQSVEISTNGGTSWIEIGNNADLGQLTAGGGDAFPNPTTRNYNVSDALNGVIPATLKFRFRVTWPSTAGDNSGVMYGWFVDNVKFIEGYANDLKYDFASAITGVQRLTYTKFPANQTSATAIVTVTANTKNVGSASQDAVLTATATGYTGTSAPVAIPAFGEDSLVTAPAYVIPSTVGTYNMTATLSSDNNELSNTTEDVVVFPFAVTASVMAVDAYNGTAASMDGSFIAWADQTEGDFAAIGNVFETFADGVIGSAQVGIKNLVAADQVVYDGRTFFVTVLRDNGTEFEVVTQSNEFELNNASGSANSFGKLHRLYFDSPIDVVAGETYIVVACSFVGSEDGAVPIAFSGKIAAGNCVGYQAADFSQLISLASDDATPNVVEAPVVRIDFTDYSSVAELEMASDVVVAPNPFSAETAINFTLKADAEVSVVITDLSGRTVLTVPAKQMTAGAQTVSIDGSAFTAGVYNYSLTVAGNTITKRIVKK